MEETGFFFIWFLIGAINSLSLFIPHPSHNISQPHSHDKEMVLGRRLCQGHLLCVVLVVATPTVRQSPLSSYSHINIPFIPADSEIQVRVYVCVRFILSLC